MTDRQTVEQEVKRLWNAGQAYTALVTMARAIDAELQHNLDCSEHAPQPDHIVDANKMVQPDPQPARTELAFGDRVRHEKRGQEGIFWRLDRDHPDAALCFTPDYDVTCFWSVADLTRLPSDRERVLDLEHELKQLNQYIVEPARELFAWSQKNLKGDPGEEHHILIPRSYDAMRDRAEAAEADAVSLKAALDTLRDRLRDRNTQLKAAERLLANAEQSLRAIDEQHIECEERLQAAERELAEAKRCAATNHANAMQAVSNAVQYVRQLQAAEVRASELEAESADLRANLDAEQDKSRELEEQLEASTERFRNLLTSFHVRGEQKAAAEARAREMEAELANLRANLDAEQDRVRELEITVQAMQKKLGTERQYSSDQSARVTELEGRLGQGPLTGFSAWAQLDAILSDATPAERRTVMVSGVPVTQSSGNVFADLGLPDAEKLLAEADRDIAEARCERCEKKDREIERALGYIQCYGAHDPNCKFWDPHDTPCDCGWEIANEWRQKMDILLAPPQRGENGTEVGNE